LQPGLEYKRASGTQNNLPLAKGANARKNGHTQLSFFLVCAICQEGM
jgi:hypothetical protein